MPEAVLYYASNCNVPAQVYSVAPGVLATLVRMVISLVQRWNSMDRTRLYSLDAHRSCEHMMKNLASVSEGPLEQFGISRIASYKNTCFPVGGSLREAQLRE